MHWNYAASGGVCHTCTADLSEGIRTETNGEYLDRLRGAYTERRRQSRQRSKEAETRDYAVTEPSEGG